MANPYFNATYYLTNNPDLNAAGINTPEAAWNHYVQYGAAEALGGGASRSPAPWFDIVYYLQNNSDLATAGLSGSQLFEHFTTYGINEGRAPSAAAANVNDATLTQYAAANEDLQEAFGIDDLDNITEEQYDQLAQHLYQFGYSEGRGGDPLVPAPEPTDNKLTVGHDHIVATSAGQTFTAPLEQAPFLGNVSNTLESGDIINAMGEGNKLVADLTFGTTGGIPIAPAISATTTNVQVVELRAQTVNTDIVTPPHGNASHIDAENMIGVEEWWTVNSRASIQIEDIRTRPEDTLIGMRNTDPHVGFFVYFDPEQLSNNPTVSDSALTLTLDSISAPGDLTEVPVNGVAFTLGGESYTLQSEEIGTAANHGELLIALSEAAAADPALEGLQFTLNADNTITIVDPDGRVFVPGSWSFVNNEVPSSGDIIWDQQAGAPVRGEEPITTDVVLDNVGRTSQGGDLDIGSLGDGGVEVFNVSVDRDSWVTSMRSGEHLGVNEENEFLETVNLTSIGANGDLAVGNYVGDARTGALDDRVENGLENVREVLNQGFEGDLSYGVALDGDSIARYLDDADGVVQFTYEGGDGNDNITIYEEEVSGDNDFAMSVDLGAGDDRLNLTIEDARNVSVDGGEGNNTIAVAQSHGTSADNTFAEFANFQTYEVERFGSTEHDFESMQGVTAINIATLWGASTDLINVATDAEVLITGKNQTLDSNSNEDQWFGNIAIDSEDIVGGDNTLRVTLQNTARLDGVLFVNELEIGDLDGDTDPIRTLELVSAGRRDTVNVLFDLDAEGVNTFNLTGTQDLFVDLTAAANSTAAAAQRDNLVVNGAELEGTLDLDVDGDIITAINDASKTVTLTGTDNDDDVLGIDGSGLDITNNTTVNGFETVEFWGTGGEVNVTNFNGVEQYRIESSAANFEMNHMQGNENVWVDADAAGHTLTFVAAAQSNTNVLDIEYETTATTRTVVLEAQDFRTIQLDLGGEDNVNNAYTVDLTLLDENGDDPSVAPSYDLVYARTLVITGGGDQGAAGVAQGVDSVDLGALENTLNRIDFSDYVGEVTLTLDTGVMLNRNVDIELNGYGASIDEDANDHNIVTYKLTMDTVAAAAEADSTAPTIGGDNVVVINGFDAFDQTGIDVTNVSVLDFAALNINGLSGLQMRDYNDGTDDFVEIVSNGDHNFTIHLVGVTVSELNNENFNFAV